VIHVFIFLPLVAAIILAFVPHVARVHLGILVAFATFLLGLCIWLEPSSTLFSTPWLPGAGVTYSVGYGVIDPLTRAYAHDGSLLLALVTSFMTLIGLIYWRSRAMHDDKATGMVPWVLAMLTGLLGTFAARDLILFYVFFEGTLIPSLFMLGRYGRADRSRAVTKTALYTVFGGLLMLAAILGAKYLTVSPTFALTDLLPRTRLLEAGTQTWLMLGFLAAFAVKTPLVPFHNWLPDFHAQNHPSGLADLMGTLYKVGGYGMYMFALPLFPVAAKNLQFVLMFIAAFTALYAAWIAFSSRDMKRLLAYAGLSHMGFVALGVFSGPIGTQGALYLLAFQGVFAGALFLVAGMLEQRIVEAETHQAESEARERDLTRALEIGHVRGLASSAPAFAGVALLLWFASIGVPGLAGFIGEFSILLEAYRASPWIAALAVCTVIAGAAFALTAYQKTWLEEATIRVPDLRPHEWLVLAPVVAAVVFFGVFSGPALKLTEPGVRALSVQLSSVNSSLNVGEVNR
jgi:NADH-quinone oxidoreductase subunit M